VEVEETAGCEVVSAVDLAAEKEGEGDGGVCCVKECIVSFVDRSICDRSGSIQLSEVGVGEM